VTLGGVGIGAGATEEFAVVAEEVSTVFAVAATMQLSLGVLQTYPVSQVHPASIPPTLGCVWSPHVAVQCA
jgi:hypothetical protein